jgi:hypothetical protein
MTETLFASFININDAERAMGALLDHGVRPKDISLVAHESHSDRLESYSASKDLKLDELKDNATNGITTTTTSDAESGALDGATIGLGVGVVAALASIFLPGIGLILGGGALALALSGAAGATGVGAVGGGVYGFLCDQGISDPHLTTYQETFVAGGAIMGIDLDGKLDRQIVEGILKKYNAENIGGYSTIIPNSPN